ncbi:hypothetical protein DACRYDRAFT_20116 [Dacryopinax primogenitus]|uniref:Uncharacterized protein n=1 Tax=Dacryopinax primogenitus (strain DJM 731) TaxID=1858805 RepID=M5GEV5_DACPD|nr:uncharacterized protein DACRYDRAFT_20116 [Dacryopinax primogenitus]EJU05717.1 hypothetical protein DACRYDRAFT_20116 [Dacryopinax primogenitus]
MPYYTRSSGRKSVSSDSAPSTPIRRASSSREIHAPPAPSPVPPSPIAKPLLHDLVISKEDEHNDILMAIVSTLANQKDPSHTMTTYDMARLIPHKANALSTCIRAHLRRTSPPHLVLRHDPQGEGKVPTYSLNLPLFAGRSQVAPSAVSQPTAHGDMELDDDNELPDDFELDVDNVDAPGPVKTEESEDFFETFSSHTGSVSPVITPPPPLSSSIPRLRSHFVENLAMPSRGISPDATSDGSSPPSTPLSPSSPLIPATVPLSPTTGILSQGFKAMLLQESTKGAMDSYASSPVLDVNVGFFPTMTMVGPAFEPQIAQEDCISYKQTAMMNAQTFIEPVTYAGETRWDSGEDWMMGPESMPIDELDRELSEAWH